MMTVCACCGVSFKTKAYRLTRNKSGVIYCSQACRRASTAGPDLICPICGVPFRRKPAEVRPVNYCSYVCAAKGSGNLRPARKGDRRSPTTEFRPGVVPTNKLPVGSVTVRQRPDRRDGARAWVKIAEPNVWRPRAVVVWERAHGPIPAGHVIHHEDRDTLNDDLSNLSLESRAAHLIEHRPEFEAKRIANLRARRR